MSTISAATFQTRHQSDDDLQQYANQSRKANRFTDICIKVKSKDFPAHRLVLASFSKFFEKTFESPMKEQYEGTVDLSQFDEEAVKLLIDFMYMGSVTINQDNVYNLLAAAHFLQLDEACQFCFDLLVTIICIENWSNIFSASRLYHNELLMEKLHHFINENFNEIAKSEALKQLSINDMTYITKNLNKSIVKGTEMYRTIINWVRHDATNRKDDLPKLLLLVDLNTLTSYFLEDEVASDPLVKENVVCVNAVMVAIIKQFKDLRLKETGSKLLSVGGLTDDCGVVEVYNLLEAPKAVYPDLSQPLLYFKSVQLNKVVYLIGGVDNFDMDGIIDKVYQMNTKYSDPKWNAVLPMNESRCCMGATVFKGCLVVAGGVKNSDTGESPSAEEAYNPEINNWKQIAKLNHSRASNELICCSNALYALGGFDNEETLSSVERLNDLNGSWEDVESMNCSRRHFAAVSCNDMIYVIGGLCQPEDGKQIVLKSVEKYNPARNKWTFVSDMNIKRKFHAACVLQGKIYVVGGMDADGERVSSIECYDPAMDRWTIVGEAEHKAILHSLVAL